MTTRHRTAAALALAGAVLLTATACGAESDATEGAKPKSSQDASPSASPSPADPQAAEKKAVLAVYGAFWAEQVKAYGQASAKGTDLERYATMQALARSLGDLQSLHGAHQTLQGTPTHEASVTGLGLEKKMPEAQIRDCIDVSKWTTMQDGKEVARPAGMLKRYVVTVSAEKWGKRWMITKADPQRQAC